MNSIDKLSAELQKSIQNADKNKKKGYDTTAEVTRIDGNTVWVRIPGGYDETPVQRTGNADIGDEVLVRIAGGRAWLIGNKTDPAAGSKRVSLVENSADLANEMADIAAKAAGDAQKSADQAQTQAGRAYEYAETAERQAVSASRSASQALSQLGIVEDVVGTLEWIREHGSYVATEDEEVEDGKVYFIYNSTAGDYEPIASPDPEKNPSEEGWYELDISEAQSDFIMAHLAATTRGLWVVPSGLATGTTPAAGETQKDSDARQASKYKMLMANDGVHIFDGSGAEISVFSQSIQFNSRVIPQYIGGENAYIVYNNITGEMTIGGSKVNITGAKITIGGVSQSLTDLLTSMQSEIDGAIETWFYAVDPTLSNEPAVNWETDEAKSTHLRDLYFNTTNGHSFRWELTSTNPNVYGWVQIADSDAAAALAAAQAAQATADNAIKTVEYAAGSSPTTHPTTGWSTASPAWAPGTYIWMRQSKDGTNYTYTCIQGAKGETGDTGPQGVSVTNVTSTNNTQDGGTSIVTVTLSDGTTKTFNVKNGNKGSTGDTAQWFYGTALTHKSGSATATVPDAVVGSMYLNTGTALVYKCTAVSDPNSTWAYAGDLTTGVIDNIEIGGRNLALESNKGWTSTDYNVIQGELSEDWVPGETYTIQIKGTPSTGCHFGVWRDDGWVVFRETIFDQKDGVWYATGICPEPREGDTVFNKFSVYDVPSTNTHSATIEWIKIEKGNKATDWTPAPEDQEARTEGVRSYTESMSEVLRNAIPTNVSELNNDAGYLISYPTSLSEYDNDLGFISESSFNSAIDAINTDFQSDINDLDTDLTNLERRVTTIETPIEIVPDLTNPYIMVHATSKSTEGESTVKIAASNIVLSGPPDGGEQISGDELETSTRIDSQHLYSKKIVTTEIYPRYRDNNDQAIGHFVFIARSTGHFSIKKV